MNETIQQIVLDQSKNYFLYVVSIMNS